MKINGLLSTVIVGVALVGCTTPKRTRFVDVQSTVYGPKIVVIEADENVVCLRVSGPNEPVFLAMVEPRVIEDGLYLFPHYITKPIVSERLEVPVIELDLPTEWRDRIFWVEDESVPRWFQVFRERVRTIQRRHLELPESHESS